VRTLQRFTATAAALAAGALIATSMAAPAQAAATKDKPIDITKVIVKDAVITKSGAEALNKLYKVGSGCLNVPMSLKYSTYRGTKASSWVGVVGLGDVKHDNPSGFYFAPGMAASTTIKSSGANAFLCKRVGRIDYEVGGSMSRDGKKAFDNPTKVTGSFKVRQDAATTLTAKRSGKTVTLTAKATYFNVKTGKTSAYNPNGATVQVKNGSKWVKVNKKVTFKGGKATIKVSQKAKKSYKITFKATTTVIGKTSKVVTK
jgi:hypothetical protein